MEYQPVNFTKRSDEQLSNDVKYVFDVVRSYRKTLDHLKLPLVDLSIVEIGPGSDFGAQLILASMGAKITLADRFLTRFDPDYHPKLYAEVARQWDGPKNELMAAISGGHEATSLRLLQEQAESVKSIADESVDFVFSNAVLEHVADIHAVTQELARITKPGGWGVHQIDWRDHRDFSRPLEHLVMEEKEFQEMAPKLAYDFGNRVRMIEFCSHFEASGFTLVEHGELLLADKSYLAEVLPRLRSSTSIYRLWPEEDLCRVSGCLYFRREFAKENLARSRGQDLLAFIRLFKSASQDEYRELLREQKIAVSEKRICELTQALNERDKKIDALCRARDELEAVLGSTSWRCTAPLRWVGGLIAAVTRAQTH
jgi:SAM-dependent methyltransferase